MLLLNRWAGSRLESCAALPVFCSRGEPLTRSCPSPLHLLSSHYADLNSLSLSAGCSPPPRGHLGLCVSCCTIKWHIQCSPLIHPGLGIFQFKYVWENLSSWMDVVWTLNRFCCKKWTIDMVLGTENLIFRGNAYTLQRVYWNNCVCPYIYVSVYRII